MEKAQRCNGVRWHQVSSRRSAEDCRCKVSAHYKFKARRVKYPESKSGTYCIHHLYSQFYTNTEYDRFIKAGKAFMEEEKRRSG